MFPVGGRYDLLYEIEHVTGFAMIDAFFAEGKYRARFAKCHRAYGIALSGFSTSANYSGAIRLMRASVAEVMTQKTTSVQHELKVFSTREIVTQHVLRNAIPPIIPKVGVQLSSMLTLAIITESIFQLARYWSLATRCSV